MKPERKIVNPEPWTEDEPMQQSRFMVLTGHLNDYPLSDLVGILRHQRKTGRLLIDYTNGPAMFFFKDGEFVDAQLDNLNGLQAICVALAQPPAPFNFNPLMQPTRRSIQNSLQRAVSELLGCWDWSGPEIENPALFGTSSPPELPAPQVTLEAESTSAVRPELLLGPKPPTNRYGTTTIAMAAAGLMMLGLSSVIAVTAGFGTRTVSAPRVSSPSLSPVDSEPEISPPSTSIPARAELRTKLKSPEAAGSREIISAPADSRNPSVKKEERKSAAQPVSAEKTQTSEEATKRTSEASPGVQSVRVVLQIENGRVLRASIANPQPGMGAYESLALRIARQRRFPSKSAGQETVIIRINPPGHEQ